MIIKPNYYEELLFVETKISENLLNELKDTAYVMLENKSNYEDKRSKLAGQIESELTIPEKIREKIEPYVIKCCKEFHGYEIPLSALSAKEMWINFQKKYEFNPLHAHNGLFSFVLWINVPYKIQDEFELDICKYSNSESAGIFQFAHSSLNGSIKTTSIYADKSYEGTMILFPSWLQHKVHPFYTSDDYRISISGNVFPFKESKKLKFSY